MFLRTAIRSARTTQTTRRHRYYASSTQKDPTKKILVGVDGSPESFLALKEATSLASPDSHVAVISVLEPVKGNWFNKEMVTEIDESAKSQQELTLQRVKTLLSEENIQNWDWISRSGHAAEAICKEVKERNVDYLIVGSKGWGGMQKLLVGSICNFCVHHAPCHVLVVKNPDVAEKETETEQPPAEDAAAKPEEPEKAEKADEASK
mmetsp:Transcript_14489/g.16084  ORF Transcript_14489/g.16084 Transcript_14489/m.16084 type:complete len:207 (+) Transcript_14489:2-622(+)